MEEGSSSSAGWFAGLEGEDDQAAITAIREGTADLPASWSTLAVETGFASSRDAYYDRLHDAAMAATRAAVREAETADDQQLIHTIRAMDDCQRVANELAERVAEWAGSVDESGAGMAFVREVAASDRDDSVVSLACRARDLDEEAVSLQRRVERTAPAVAPNLSMLAGPVLAARLIALAGSLKELARQPAGTVQVLGAEEALFAHLRGNAPSPKHGVIYTHPAVRGTHPAHRGSAARAVAGKLTIAARIDHYSGRRHSELEADLTDRIDRIQGRETE